MLRLDDFRVPVMVASFGHFAPCSIQARSRPISARVNGWCGLGGMILTSSSSPATASSSRLWTASPGLMTGPESLPFSASLAQSRRRPAFCLPSPWHEMQASAMIGWMSRWKLIGSLAAGGSWLAVEAVSSSAPISTPQKSGRTAMTM